MAVQRNNPGNVELGSGKWQGLTAPHLQTSRFASFVDIPFGIRAIAVCLSTFQDKYDIRTIKAAIERYAPAKDKNPTAKYIENVCTWTGLKPAQILDFHSWAHVRPVVAAIIKQESGANHGVTDAQIDKGLVMAGIHPPAEAERPSRTIAGAKVAATGLSIEVVSRVVEAVVPASDILSRFLQIAPWAVVALGVAGLAYIVWARIDDRRRGLR